MNTTFWRQGAAAILAAGLLAIAAVAQTGEASGEVKIEGEKPPAATATAAVKPAAKTVKPVITERDPFVNQVIGGTVTSTAVGRVRTASSASGNTVRPAVNKANSVSRGSAKVEVEEVEVVEVIVPAPEVTVTGIVKSRGSHQAIINYGTTSRIVSTGQKMGDYRISGITDTAVTFTSNGKSFKIPIDSEFGLKK